MFPGSSELGCWRHVSAVLFRRSSSGINGLVLLGKGSSGKDGVASLAYDVINVEEVLHGVRRTLPPAYACIVDVRGGGTSISARRVKANAFVLALLNLNVSFDFVMFSFNSFVDQKVCFH